MPKQHAKKPPEIQVPISTPSPKAISAHPHSWLCRHIKTPPAQSMQEVSVILTAKISFPDFIGL